MNNETIRTVRLLVNGDEAKNVLEKVDKELVKMKGLIEKAWAEGDSKGIKKYSREIAKLEKQHEKIVGRSREVTRTMENLDKATPKKLKEAIKELNRQLDSGAVERNSEQWEHLQQAIREAREEITKIKQEQNSLKESTPEDATKSFGGSISKWANKWWAAIDLVGSSFQRAMGAMQGYVDDFARMDDAMTQTKKYTGMTRQEVEELNEEFKKIDTATPREKLNALAADAGRLGIQSKDAVLEFVQAADLINIALGEDLGEDAVKNIGKLAQLFGDADSMGLKQAMLSTASTINELAQSSSASEGYIMNFTSRLAGVGKQAGMSQAQVMAFASVLDQNMVGCERGATALQNVIMKLYKEPEKMAKAAGMDVQKFTKLLHTDGNAALLQFIETLSKAGKIDALAPMFADMKVSGSGISQTLTTLASNIDTLRQTQEQATLAFRDGTSAEKEAASQRESAAYKLEQYKKEAHELSVELGSQLYPIMTSGMRLSSSIVKIVASLIGWMGKHARTIVWLAGTIASLTLAIKAQSVATVLANAITKAYTAVVKQHIIVEAAHNAWVKATRALTIGYNAVLLGLKTIYSVLTGKTIALTVAQRALNISMKANPIGFIASAVIKLITVIASLIGLYKVFDSILGDTNNSLTLQQKLQQDSANLHNKVAESTAKEITKIKTLTAIIHDNSRSYGERMNAINVLKKIIPSYVATIDKETGALKENAKAVSDYITMLKKKAMAEAVADANADLAGQYNVNLQSRNRRNNALIIRKNRLSALKQQYPMFADLIQDVADGRRTIASILTDDKHTQEVLKLRVKGDKRDFRGIWSQARDLGKAIREAQGWVDEVDATLGELDKRMDANIRTAEQYGADVISAIDSAVGNVTPESAPTGGAGGSGGSGSGNNKNDKLEKEHREKLKQLDAEAKDLDRKLQETIQSYNVAFAEGKLDVDAYRRNVIQAEMTTAMQQRDLYDKNLDWQVEKWKERNDKVLQLEKTQAEKMQAWTIAALEKNEQRELHVLEKKHSQGLISETAYQIERNAITLKYLRQREKYYRKWGRVEDYDKAQLAVEKEVARQRIEMLKKVSDAQKKLREEYMAKHPLEQAQEELRMLREIQTALINQFAGDTAKMMEITTIWNKLIGNVEKRIANLKKGEGARVLSEAGYNVPSVGSGGDITDGIISVVKQYQNEQDTRQKLIDQLNSGDITQGEYNLAIEEFEKLKYERIAGYATACYQTVSGAMQAASQLMQANYEIEAQKVEERYAREIAAAGEGTDKAKQLEARKQKELANLKNKYNKKAMAVEMAQAVAQTAVAAINAYASASKVAFWLGPVAAAAATAAGAIQIAAIAKQHEAQSAGYYEGGFTGGQNYRREAGVVHEGEFVANHQAVKNPNLLPVLNMIDQAQRHNRVASLTAADVNRVAGGTAVAAAPQPVIIDSSSLRTAESIEKLNRMLEHPIKTYVVIDGPDGLHRNYQEYKKIIGEE